MGTNRTGGSPMRELKKKAQDAQDHYNTIANTGTTAEVRKASDAVKATKAAIAAKITEGAKPCPKCGTHPHGMMQQTGRNGATFEIGCINCGPFKHDDGSVRQFRVRGGLLPRHAVEAWNGGADFWMKHPDQDVDVKPFVIPTTWGATKPEGSELES